MAKPAARLGDNVAHKKAAGAILKGSTNVLVNGLPAARQSDPVQHNKVVEVITQGSSTVLFNSLPASRITDMVACGGKIAAGSGNVLIGDGGAVACSGCPDKGTVGNPVNPLLGAKVLGGASELDFALPGPLAVVWQRQYSSYVGPAGAESGILGQGWRLPFEMHLKFAHDKTELFDTKNRVITFGPLAPGEQEHSRSEGFWLLRGGRTATPPALHKLPQGVKLGDLHPATRSLYAHEPWQDEPRWAHIPAQWRDNPHCCLAATADRNVWLFLCLDDSPTAASPWLLVALFDVFGRMQRFERATSSQARNLPEGLVNAKRPRPNEPELPLGQLTALVDGLGRRFELQYTQLGLTAPDTPTGDTGLRLQAVAVHDPSSPELQRAMNGRPLVRYHYSPQGDLIKVADRHGRAVREFTYEVAPIHATTTQRRMTSHRVLGGPVARYSYEEQPAPGKAYCRVVWQRNEGGLDYHFDYQADQTVVTDSLGRTTTYAFKGEGGKQRLSQLTDAMGGVTQYEHDLYGQLMQETDPLGRITQYRRDAQGRLSGFVLPDRSQTQSQWHDTLNTLSSVQGPDGVSTTFTHDQWGRLLQSSVEGSGVCSITQHRYADPASSEHARLTADFPVQIIDAKGGVKSLHWSASGQLLRYTDCSKQSTQYVYDVWGELAQVTNALGETVTYHRNALGQLTTITYPDKTQVHYHYDERGQVSQVVDAAGGISSYERDRHGRVLTSIQAQSANARSIRFQYDLAARLIQLTNENGAHTRFAYDALDRLIEEVGFDGRRQCYQYDAAGQLTASADQGPLPGTHQNAGQLSAPLITRYDYDLAGRLLTRHVPAVLQSTPQNKQPSQTVFPEQVQHFTYDKAGRLLESRCNKTSVQFKRDSLGRLVEEKLVHEDTNPYTSQIAASIAAQHIAQFSHQLTHSYDALGVREASRLPHVGEINYLHYGSGHLHQVAHNQTALVDFERDALHRETLRRLSGLLPVDSAPHGQTHQDDNGITLHRSFDPMGRLLRLSSHSVAEVMGRAQAHAITRDLNTMEPLVGGPPAPTINALSRDYTYDPVGQLIAVGQNTQQFLGHNAPKPKATRYQYDAAHRLVGAQYSDGQVQTWQFDPAGNRLPDVPPAAQATAHYSPGGGNGSNGGDSWLTRAAPATPTAAQHRYWADNRIHQATSEVTTEVNGRIQTHTQTQTIEYDAWGNIRRMHTTSGPNKGQTLDLLYDGLHQLRASQLFEPDAVLPGASTMANPLQGNTQGAGSTSGKTTTTFYDYDPLGRRVSKTVVDQTPGQARKIEARTWFGWDGDRLVTTETDTVAGRKAISTVYEPKSFVPLLRFEIDVGGKSKPTPSMPEVLHYHCNHIGTPEALIDRRGQVVWQAEFDPWGNLRSEYNPSQIHQPIRMQGQQVDCETGLFYNRFRYYKSSISRYLTQDPIGVFGGANKYSYPLNPVYLVDPLGLFQVYGYRSPQTGQVSFSFDFSNPSLLEAKQAVLDLKIPGAKNLKKPLEIERDLQKSKSAGAFDSTDPVAACGCDSALKSIFEKNWGYKSGGPAAGTNFSREAAEKILADFKILLTETKPPYDKGNIKGGEACKGLYKWDEILDTATKRATDVRGTFGGYIK
jgi:RHS repeat-associated protein